MVSMGPQSAPMTIYEHPDTLGIVRAALREDLGYAGDITCRSVVAPGARLKATVTAKEAGVLCGMPLFAKVFSELEADVQIEHCSADGTSVSVGDVVLRCEGPADVLLMGERTGLNLAQRLSGVSTATRRYVQEVEGTKAGIYDTRKTTPGLRLLQKHAVLMGGGRNHRIGLYDQVLIKENHIALMDGDGSSPAQAVAQSRSFLGPDAIIQVEVETLDDLRPVIDAGADIVLLDNMGPELLRKAIEIRGADTTQLEASGGITLQTLRPVAETGIDRISIGALTHSVTSLDLSMRCVRV